MKRIILLTTLISCLMFNSLSAVADNVTDSNKLFDWAEINFPQYFSPSGMETSELAGYLVRHYENTDIYLGA